MSKLISDIAKEIGGITLSSGTIRSQIDFWISTGCRAIDRMLEVGLDIPIWLPYGRIIELAGREHSGKTSVLSQVFAKAQQQDNAICVLADVEQTYDSKYAKSLGVNVDELIFMDVNYIEDFFIQLNNLLDVTTTKAPDRKVVVGWDSLGQTASYAEMHTKIDPKTGKHKVPPMMAAARAVAQDIRRINQRLSNTQTMLIICNQLYNKPVLFGDPWESYGGNRLRFASSIRMRFMPSAVIKYNGEPIGQWVNVHLIKTKLAPGSFRVVKVPLLHGEGFSDGYMIYEDAGKRKPIAESIAIRGGNGLWVTSSGDEIKFKGWNGFKKKVIPHPDFSNLVDEFYGELDVEDFENNIQTDEVFDEIEEE